MSKLLKNVDSYVRMQDGSGNAINSSAGALSVSFGTDVTSATHDNFNVNSNMQIGDADLAFGQSTMANSLPVAVASDQGALTVDGSGVTQPISATSLPLPTGAATEASLTSIDGKVTACNTGAVTISARPQGSSAVWSGYAATGGDKSSSFDMKNYTVLNVIGNVSGSAIIEVEASDDDTNWYKTGTSYASLGSEDFYMSMSGFGARYVRVSIDSSVTVTAILCGK